MIYHCPSFTFFPTRMAMSCDEFAIFGLRERASIATCSSCSNKTATSRTWPRSAAEANLTWRSSPKTTTSGPPSQATTSSPSTSLEHHSFFVTLRRDLQKNISQKTYSDSGKTNDTQPGTIKKLLILPSTRSVFVFFFFASKDQFEQAVRIIDWGNKTQQSTWINENWLFHIILDLWNMSTGFHQTWTRGWNQHNI